MIILRNGEAKYEEEWERFIRGNDNVGVFYSLTVLNEHLEVCREQAAKNLSFIIVHEDKPAAIVPLLLKEENGFRFFSTRWGFGSLYGPVVGSSLGEKLRRQIRDSAFEEIDRLARECQVAKVMVSIHPFERFFEKEYFNYLHKYGFLDASIETQIIDLTEKIETLKAGRRKHCKALVNNGLKLYTFFAMDKDCADYEIHEAYRLMHAKASGRATRSKRSFDLQYESITKGEATLIGAQFRGETVQIAFFDHLNGYVFYSSSADDPDFNACDVPISHSLLWYAIEHFKNKGFKYFELGAQLFGNQFFSCPSPKEIDISFFKRGFGGMTVPLFRGIKYYHADYMKADMEEHFERLLQASQSLNGNALGG